MQVKISNKGNILIAKVFGEIDHHSAEYMRKKIDSEIMKATTKNLIMDFIGISFMDSSGIGLLMGRYKSIDKIGGRTAVVISEDRIRRVFEMAGITKIIPFYKNHDDAVEAMLQRI